jgi:ankyrin repeat protein
MKGGVDVNSEDRLGRTPLSYAVQSGHERIVELLLANGAEFGSVDHQEKTPLISPTERGEEVMGELLSRAVL